MTEQRIQAIAEVMRLEYEAQMAADNDNSPLPHIYWHKIAQVVIDELERTDDL